MGSAKDRSASIPAAPASHGTVVIPAHRRPALQGMVSSVSSTRDIISVIGVTSMIGSPEKRSGSRRSAGTASIGTQVAFDHERAEEIAAYLDSMRDLWIS
jgi:hypothetical protein